MTILTVPQRPVVAALGSRAASFLFVPMSLNVVGQINGGGVQTAGYGSARWIIDSASIRGEDGTTTDYGAGPGVTAAIKSDGSAFFQKILLQSFGSGARMVFDSTVPIFKVIDSAGVVRAELGDLAASGVSTAGYKIRASDAGNVPLFDSDGLISVMQQPSPAAVWAGGTVVLPAGTLGNWTMIPGSSVAFTLMRPTVMFIVATYTAQLTSGVLNLASAGITLNGTNPHAESSLAAYDTQGGARANGTILLSDTLAAGSWTAQLCASVAVGAPTATLDSFGGAGGNLYVFQLGA